MDQLTPINVDKGMVRIFCAGGAGIGIGKYFEAERSRDIQGYARLSPVYMDTSKASTYGVPEDDFFHLPDACGSGGVRSYNGQDIIRYTGEMLQKFQPTDFNIVIHSTTGGSGSVMGPSIVSELLNQDKGVIVLTVGSDDTLQFIENTIGTMASYESIAKMREKPVIIHHLQNGLDGTIEQVDTKIHVIISCLSVLFSAQNKNLDNRDLYNWLHFNNVTSYGPQVAVLTVYQREFKEQDANIISVATLNNDLNNTKIGYPVEFQRVGVPMLMQDDTDLMDFPLHYVISDGFLDTVVKSLRKQKQDYQTKANARVQRNKLTDGNENVASNGLVF